MKIRNWTPRVKYRNIRRQEQIGKGEHLQSLTHRPVLIACPQGVKKRRPRQARCGSGLRDGLRPFVALNQMGARHILTISVRYFGSRAAISFPFSAISSDVGFGGGDARRERCTVRQVNLTLSLAFLAPPLVKAAVEGRLPRGINIERLRDPDVLWSQQFQDLGLNQN